MNNYKRRVAAASLATVAVLGINARIDNDRVFQQAKAATEEATLIPPVVNECVMTAKWFPMAEYAAIGIVSGGALTVQDMYEPDNSYVSRMELCRNE